MYYFESVTDLCFLNKVAVRTNWDCKHFYLPVEWTHLLYMLSNWHCPTNVSLECEQSLFFFRFSESNTRARERRSRETRETCLSRLALSVTRVAICVSRVLLDGLQKKRETARSLMWVVLLNSSNSSAMISFLGSQLRMLPPSVLLKIKWSPPLPPPPAPPHRKNSRFKFLPRAARLPK